MFFFRCVWFLFALIPLCAGASLEALPEYLRPDPFGGIVAPDRVKGSGFVQKVEFRSPRAGYVSFHLVAKVPEGGEYSLRLRINGPVQADLFREWFHFTDRDRHYYPDALVPVKPPYRSRMPEPDNRIDKQTAQGFWVDLWIPADAPPGTYRGEATLEAGGAAHTLPFSVQVLQTRVPAGDVITLDHNSYGSEWIAAQFPKERQRLGDGFFQSDAFFRLIHAYHRIFYEHRGTFHQLGYGHAGKVGPEFAPALEGSGRNRRIASWDLYDRHYGPLLDGSAFANTRRGAKPIPFVYLPINPEWPASYLWWGEPGYEAEFVNVVSAMERHFREKGWTQTRFEMFFNHKKRYMGFSWDGDEVRFPKDDQYFLDYGKLLKKALPADTPVKFVFRADASWSMEQQFRKLAGVVNMWVCGSGILSWYPEAPVMLRKRGDVVWFYSGPPPVNQPASTITRFALQGWIWGVDGFIHWLTVSPGRDPWFHYDGGGTALVYSGERFGVEEPIAGIRLKIQRNTLQDLALLDSVRERRGLEALRREATQRFNRSNPEQWWNPRPKFADLPPDEWVGTDIDKATQATDRLWSHLDPDAWQRVHEFVIQLAAEEK